MKWIQIVEAKAPLKKFIVAWGRNQYVHLGNLEFMAPTERAARKMARDQLDNMYFKGHGFKILYTIEKEGG